MLFEIFSQFLTGHLELSQFIAILIENSYKEFGNCVHVVQRTDIQRDLRLCELVLGDIDAGNLIGRFCLINSEAKRNFITAIIALDRAVGVCILSLVLGSSDNVVVAFFLEVRFKDRVNVLVMSIYSILVYLEISAFNKFAVVAVLVKSEAALCELVDVDLSENNISFLIREVVLYKVGSKRIVVVIIRGTESVDTECDGNRLFVARKVSDYSCCKVNVIVLTNLLEILESDCALVIAEGVLNHFQYIRLLHTLEVDGSHTSCGIDITVLDLRCDRILEYHVVLIRSNELHDRLCSVDYELVYLDNLCRVACKVCVIDFNCVISVITVVNACGVIISAAAKSAYSGCRDAALLDSSGLVDLHITCTEVVLMNSDSCCSGILVILAVLRTVVVKSDIDHRDSLIDGECLRRCSLISH